MSRRQVYLTWDAAAQQYGAWPSEGGMTEFHAHTQEVRQPGPPVASSRAPGVGLAPVSAGARRSRDGGGRRLRPGPGQRAPLPDNPRRAVRDVRRARAKPRGRPGAGRHRPHVRACTGPVSAGICCRVPRHGPQARFACKIPASQSARRLMAFGGIYIAGGLAPKLQPRVQQVMPAVYLDDPVMRDLIAQVRGSPTSPPPTRRRRCRCTSSPTSSWGCWGRACGRTDSWPSSQTAVIVLLAGVL